MWRCRNGARVGAVPVPHRVTVYHPRLGVVDMHASAPARSPEGALGVGDVLVTVAEPYRWFVMPYAGGGPALAEVPPDVLVGEATSGRRRAALFTGRPYLDVEVFDERAEAERVARDRGWRP
jgi:hypothetical protein